MTTISVITPVLNGEAFIRETVDSVLSQEGDFDLEYIVRDGESTDGTLKILAEYEGRCTVVSQKDGSPQEAINAGMAMARGEIVAWLNADDVYEPGTLQRVVETFQRYPKQQWCYGYCSIMDENGAEIRKPITWYKSILGYIYSRHILLCENYVNQPSTFWKRALWEDVGGLDKMHKAAFDYLLWMKMARISPAASIHARLARFRRHPGSISENQFAKQFDEELAIAREYGNVLHVALHTLNKWKIILIYRLLGALGR